MPPCATHPAVDGGEQEGGGQSCTDVDVIATYINTDIDVYMRMLCVPFRWRLVVRPQPVAHPDGQCWPSVLKKREPVSHLTKNL